MNPIMTVLAIMFMKTLLWYFTFFPIGPVCAFIIIKSCSEIRFCLTNIRSFPAYSTFYEINDLLRVTVKYPTLNFKCFTTGFVSHIKSQTWQFPFPYDSDLPVISTFGNFAVTKDIREISWMSHNASFCSFL